MDDSDPNFSGIRAQESTSFCCRSDEVANIIDEVQLPSWGVFEFIMVNSLVVHQAESRAQIAQARELFLEYAQSLGFSLCFQGFDKELASLPGDYAPPEGRLLLAEHDGRLAGCVALHKFENEICEMKRLYLRPAFRGKGIGRSLAETIIREAREAGYKRMRLDTVEPVMKDAVEMYRKLGFKEIAPYRTNPVEGAIYMELLL